MADELTRPVFKRTYDGNSLPDAQYDIMDAVEFAMDSGHLPVEDGFLTGRLHVTVTWEPDVVENLLCD